MPASDPNPNHNPSPHPHPSPRPSPSRRPQPSPNANQARQPMPADLLAPAGRLPLRQSRTPRKPKNERPLPGHHLLRASSTGALLTPRGQRVGLLTPRSQAPTPRETNRLSPGWESTMMASPTGWDSTNLHPCYSPERRASLALSPTKLERLELERSNSSKPNVDLLHPTSDVFHSTPFQVRARVRGRVRVRVRVRGRVRVRA